MHAFSSFERLKRKTEKRLEEHNKPSTNFFVLITLASAIVSLGLILDNTAIVIGGMVVAPLVTPIFGFSLRLILFRLQGMLDSALSILLGTIFAVVTSMIVGFIAIFIEGATIVPTAEILLRTYSGILFFLVAFLSGMAGAYAYAKPKVLSSITGIAISVALVPPLSVTGLGIALQNMSLTKESFTLYLFNLVGIALGSLVMFLLLGFGGEKKKKKK